MPYMIIRTHWYNPLPCATICHRYNRSIYTVSTITFPHAGSGFSSPPNSPLLSDSFGSCLCFLTQGMAEIKITTFNSSSNRSEICRTKSANLSQYFGSRSIPALRNNGIAKGRQCISVYHMCLHTCSSEHALFSGLSGLSSFPSEDKSTSATALIL